LLSRAPNPDQLLVARRLGVTKIRTCMRVSHVSPNIEIVPFNNDINTLERAVKERVFYVKNIDKSEGAPEFTTPPRPEPHYFAERLGETFSRLKRYLPSTAPMTHQQFVDSVPGRKRKAYQNALDLIFAEGFDVKRDSEVKVFVKLEKTDRTSKSDPVPRVISPRNPKFNIALGRYLRPMEERIFKALGKLFGHPTVMKGMDTDKMADTLLQKWEMFNNPVAIGLDASRFDQHVSLDALKFEHSVYLECVKTRKHKMKLQRLLSSQLRNTCFGRTEDGTLRYVVDGTRMSGDMNTSLGNCVLMCCMIYAYALSKSVPVQLANNGDDCVVFMEKSHLKQFSDGLFEWFLKMGFNMAIEEPVYEFEQIEFCQTKPVFDGKIYTMCRNPITAIAKDSVYLKNESNFHTYEAWLNAVGTGGLALAGGMPIFDAFYNLYKRSGKVSWFSARRKRNKTLESSDDVLPWYMRENHLHGTRVSQEPTPEARCSFWTAWGITPDEQICLEKHYHGLSLNVSRLEKAEFVPRSVFSDSFV